MNIKPPAESRPEDWLCQKKVVIISILNGGKPVIIAILENPALKVKRKKNGDIEYMDREKITQIIILNIIETEVEVLKEIVDGTVEEGKVQTDQEIEIGKIEIIEVVTTEGILLIDEDEAGEARFGTYYLTYCLFK